MEKTVQLKLIVVGKHNFEAVKSELRYFLDNGNIKAIKAINTGSLGNFNLFNIEVDISEIIAILVRRDIIRRIREHYSNLLVLSNCGDYTEVYILERSAFRTRALTRGDDVK